MKKIIIVLLCVALGSALLCGCKGKEINACPDVPFSVEFNKIDFDNNDTIYGCTTYANGDSLYGRVIIGLDSISYNTIIDKIDCRLGNIVIGSSEDSRICSFGVRLKDKPIGVHTFSIIVKCEAPGYDLTFLRYDLETINIKE